MKKILVIVLTVIVLLGIGYFVNENFQGIMDKAVDKWQGLEVADFIPRAATEIQIGYSK